ncbi:hypothetical protein HELRODRAFT_64188, partial [Helobdella robusta]|uniref:PPPDE domain-containing protein n=1 Tax=Helobdella robusta TaxID=6412 RepID=T1FXR1_HELRO
MTLYNVDLYIYDLSQGLAKTLGSLIFRKPVAGVWHTGVVVYGTEYFFGTQGIQFIQPGGTILGHTYRIHNMGKTEVPKELFEEYLRDLADDKFRYDKYHLLDHNCNTFSNEICLFLLNKHIPDYITNLPQEFKQSPLGNFIKPLLDEI